MRRRSMLMSGAAALVAASMPSFAQEQAEGMVLRRPQAPGEDEFLYHYSQAGRVLPSRKASVVKIDEINVIMHYPLYTFSAPLIVFSHGAIADPRGYRILLDHLVSHGFVVAAPVHDDSVFQRGLLARRSSVEGPSVWEMDRVLNDEEAWSDRCRACLKPLDIPELLGETIGMQVDVKRPIIIGHELGAFVAALCLGARVTLPDGEVRSFADDRWFAGAMLSAQGAGMMGLDDTSWAAVTRPLLVMQGAKETDFTGQDPLKKTDAFWKSAAGNKHLGWFPEGGRLMFSGPRAGGGQAEVNQYENVKALLAAFVDAYGNYRDEVFSLLATDWLDRASRNTVETRYR